ncbi:hypothetical protein J8273_0062 [Carpediemonas membranifera]|uniref:Uncharacterized protein n=1 Tax=Carpediemonas membranifera TaxID=201153 RepID=A0A8J6EAL3_9EUKA|nr:hypothetical protein J8273_0062 [Carpediemonas membranifera]|eukprot:KAG9394855.1 hypothetical protein J8273_0062 [Carpediemonas membranifera]
MMASTPRHSTNRRLRTRRVASAFTLAPRTLYPPHTSAHCPEQSPRTCRSPDQPTSRCANATPAHLQRGDEAEARRSPTHQPLRPDAEVDETSFMPHMGRLIDFSTFSHLILSLPAQFSQVE